MTRPLATKDYLLLSAYLDGELTAKKQVDVQARLQSDPAFKRAFEEFSYSKRLLASIPRVRAPRNFVLTPAKVKKVAKRQVFQPVWGSVSALATLFLLVVFASTHLVKYSVVAPAAAPAMENAMVVDSFAAEITPTPMIIYWNAQRNLGMGGGGGDASGMTVKGGGDVPLLGAPGVESGNSPLPETTATVAQQMDPSTLVLGIPEASTRGQVISSEVTEPVVATTKSLPRSTWLMIVSGGLALLSALLAIFTRRR